LRYIIGFLVVFLSLGSFGASAQEKDNYTIKLNSHNLLLIMNALSEKPYKDVAALIGDISQQVRVQQMMEAPKEAPPKEAPK
jgi:hypothetical protein